MGAVRFASFRIAAGFAAMLILAAPALGVEPSALTSTLVVPVDGVEKTFPKSRPKLKSPRCVSPSRPCCQTTNRAEPGLYSHRMTFVVRNDSTLK